MQLKIGIRFHRDKIIYFEINRLGQGDSASRLYAKEFTFDKSLRIK